MKAHLHSFRLDIINILVLASSVRLRYASSELKMMRRLKKSKQMLILAHYKHICLLFCNTLTGISPSIGAVGQTHLCGLWSTSYSTSKQGSNEKLYLPSPPWLFLAQRQSECIQCALVSTTYPETACYTYNRGLLCKM